MICRFSYQRFTFTFLAMVLVSSIAGCGKFSDREASKQASLDLLNSLREQVDLNGKENPDIEVGDQAPEIAGQDIDGRSFSIGDADGKVLLVSFFGKS